MTLKWKFTYLPPSGLATAAEQAKFFTKEAPMKLATDESEDMNGAEVNESVSATVSSREPQKHLYFCINNKCVLVYIVKGNNICLKVVNN